MTRVQKNKSKYTANIFKNLGKGILRTIVCFIVGLLYIVYTVVKSINNKVAKIYLKLPRVIRVVVIYAMIVIAIIGVQQPKEVVIYKDKIVIVSVDEEIKNTKTDEVAMIQEENICKFNEIECKIISKAKEIGLNEEQAFIAVSISKHETGNWTSNAFKNKNNLGGIMCSSGLRTYNSLDEGIEAFVTLLKNRYFDQGLDTIDKIGPVYCPVGADNDPNGLNQYWIPYVTNYYNSYIGN
ncbi:MAG: glucosaminidase domain-containing protein [Bacilli bacterium]|nr:glucosaminidase domain-containing protein [Bacilli bacterium]